MRKLLHIVNYVVGYLDGMKKKRLNYVESSRNGNRFLSLNKVS
jgi:hypothetical protein